MVIIREFGDGDSLAELTQLVHRAYKSLADAGLNYTACDQSEEVTASRIKGRCCLVAVEGDRFIGTLTLARGSEHEEVPAYRDPKSAIVNQFGVDPAFQGRRVGQLLHDAAISKAREWGCSELLLDTAQPAAWLVEMYLRWGYSVIGEHQFPGKSYHSVIMRLQLSA